MSIMARLELHPTLLAVAVLPLLSLSLAACGPAGEEEGPLMRPGENCLSCHDGSQREAPRFTAAGTVYETTSAAPSAGVAGVAVLLTDANGAVTTLTTNAAGNFYTTKALAMPVRVALERSGRRTTMGASAATGACASCHTVPPVSGAPGRIYAP